MPSESELASAIAEAMRSALSLLREQHPENFYYITLFTSGECLAPAVSAWSYEALSRVRAERGEAFAALIKWSHADAPYFAFADQEFTDVKRLFALRPDPHSLDAREFIEECALRLRAMEAAVAMLDREGQFGSGADRHSVLVNAEVFPPTASNTQRAQRLNPPEALGAWLSEAAEQ